MTDALVTQDVDERGLTGTAGPLECRTQVSGLRDMLCVAAEYFEHSIVTYVLEHVEGIGSTFEQRHLFEARAPGAVIPQHRHDRQLVAQRRLDVPAPDSEASIADHQNYLLTRPCELSADRHPDSVSHGCE